MSKLFYVIPLVLLSLSFADGRSTENEVIRKLQIGYLQGDVFIKKGLSGKGIRIAILDAGFPGTNTHPALKHLFDNHQILATWDFVKNDADVYSGQFHGTAVLGCIAGISKGRPLGLAPDAEFLLARTESRGEPLKEEMNWAKAVDWAIEHGANIIQSSLGYTHQRYFKYEMDGHHSIAAKAAAKAARMGVLIINSNGNEGQTKWHIIDTPADTDSIISVGAIDPETGLVASYSSVGPTADFRMKPNVIAPGKVFTTITHGGFKIMQGTSFAAPLITGFAACAWQLYRTRSAQEIIKIIEQSANLYPYYDYSNGYGCPKASRIIQPPLTTDNESVCLSQLSQQVLIRFCNSLPDKSDLAINRYLYYHISKPNGHLIKYGVYRINDLKPIQINIAGCLQGDIVRCCFNGETTQWIIKN